MSRRTFISSYSSDIYHSSLDRCVNLFMLAEANRMGIETRNLSEFFSHLKSKGIFDETKRDLEKYNLFGIIAHLAFDCDGLI